MCGPMKIPKLTPAPENRTRDLMIVRPIMYLTTTDTTQEWLVIMDTAACLFPVLGIYSDCAEVYNVDNDDCKDDYDKDDENNDDEDTDNNDCGGNDDNHHHHDDS